MPTWTLRLVACAGFVALLSRLPALDAAHAALAAGAAGALALGVHAGPSVLRALGRLLREWLRLPQLHPALPSRLHHTSRAEA